MVATEAGAVRSWSPAYSLTQPTPKNYEPTVRQRHLMEAARRDVFRVILRHTGALRKDRRLVARYVCHDKGDVPLPGPLKLLMVEAQSVLPNPANLRFSPARFQSAVAQPHPSKAALARKNRRRADSDRTAMRDGCSLHRSTFNNRTNAGRSQLRRRERPGFSRWWDTFWASIERPHHVRHDAAAVGGDQAGVFRQFVSSRRSS